MLRLIAWPLCSAPGAGGSSLRAGEENLILLLPVLCWGGEGGGGLPRLFSPSKNTLSASALEVRQKRDAFFFFPLILHRKSDSSLQGHLSALRVVLQPCFVNQTKLLTCMKPSQRVPKIILP